MDLCRCDRAAAPDGGSRYLASTSTGIVHYRCETATNGLQIFGKELIWRRLDDYSDDEDGERESLL